MQRTSNFERSTRGEETTGVDCREGSTIGMDSYDSNNELNVDSSNLNVLSGSPALLNHHQLNDDSGGHANLPNPHLLQQQQQPVSSMSGTKSWSHESDMTSLTSVPSSPSSSSVLQAETGIGYPPSLSQYSELPAPAAAPRGLQPGSSVQQQQQLSAQVGSEPQIAFSNQQVQQGVRLVNLLVECADAVANKNENQRAKLLLNEVSHMVDPYGDSMQRVASYFTYGLVAHIANIGSGSNLYRALRIKEPSATDNLDAFQVFSKICPFITFGEMGATLAILEGFQGEQDVHCIDLGMVPPGSIWSLPYQLLQGLASRSEGPPKSIQITGVYVKSLSQAGSSEAHGNEHYDQTGRHIKDYADRLNLNFTFQPVLIERLEHLQPWMLSLTRAGQAIAINCSAKLHTLLFDGGESLDRILGIVHSLRPRVFSVLEQEASHNVPDFLARFLEAIHFYSAMFDTLEATFARNNPERAKVEQLWLGQEIINIIACEDKDRVARHEKCHQWRFRLSNAGFRQMPPSKAAVSQVRSIRPISYGTGFSVFEDGGCLILSWQDRPLFSFSIWTC